MRLLRCALPLASLLLTALPAAAADHRVPSDYRSIQSAIDQAQPGDTIIVSPGIYHETIRIEQREDLILRGDVDLVFGDDGVCWDVVTDAVYGPVVSGTIHVMSSERITVESLVVTGPGPGIRIDGTRARPSRDVSIRYCNLICNEEAAIELGDHYKHVAVACTNACLSGEDLRTHWSEGVAQSPDVVITCTREVTEEGATHSAHDTHDVVVAVIDSGIDWSEPGLGCRMWRNPDEVDGNGIDDDGNGYVDDIVGWDFRDEDPDSIQGSAVHWHGTFVAGVLADVFEAQQPLSAAVTGLRIMDLRFLDARALFYTSDWPKLIRAIDYAVNQGAQIINMSIYASREPPPEVRVAIGRAVERGILVVAIAGNDASTLGPIAAWQEVLTIGAVTEAETPATFSNIGPQVDLVTYGVDVLSIMPGGSLGTASGTSFAAPRVAGLAAFQVSRNPQLAGTELEQMLREAAEDIGASGFDPETGWGLIK